MPEIAIRAEKLGKRYRIGHQRVRRYETLRDTIANACRFGRDSSKPPEDLLWALRDVSFEIQRGEVVGLIGRNGSGKSTLLKLLSRITEPTEGTAEIHGRCGTLLEVGTGFHPELTGRENIYLNGQILGMRRAEITRRFDEIVAFAEVERFLDTPVKHYSSGMYVRLAFAVAAHLETEILLVDEVLAVGDAAFQKKCLGKMGDVAKEGRTILFVSHNMDAMRRLCQQALWIDAGGIRMADKVEPCVSAYLLRDVREGGKVVFDPPHQLANGMPVRLHAVYMEDPSGKVSNRFSTRSPIRVCIDWEATTRLYKPRLGFVLLTSSGQEVVTALDATSWQSEWIEPGRRISSCVIPGQLLNEGEYVIDISGDGLGPGKYDLTRGRIGAVLRFEIEDNQTLPNKYYGQEGFRDAKWPGVLLLNIPWSQQLTSEQKGS